MTPEQLKNLFTLFFSTKGSKEPGWAFHHDKIIRQHGGSITVIRRRPGTRFGIMIPRKVKGKEQSA